ncbi:short-chain dehydrogenase [Virgisporangium aliadipatigenens]|uniref:Short-chain dehydrogenase n=1 Tax=Virgisporangium aliadipatigenens TaxID=741659 RepID=A0A8J3YJV0_9ACTN|nr:SDR family NAD(P)-dependent oxidoreductase [Virgisporangium aliadipatigenens]GIJ45261.1 short-chain dehydrogenase [Virgisporangium aliadipatigenens]
MSEQRIALVTGANKGIGFAAAEGLARHGTTVVVAARAHDKGKIAAERIGGRPVVLDVTDAASVRAAARTVEEWYGRLDVLVNNAGISGGRAGQGVGDAAEDVLRQVFETNLFGVVRVTEAFLPLLRRSADARIVNVSSGTGSLGWMTDPAHYFARMPGVLGYPVSKTALNMLTVQYAKSLGPDGITVNAIAPGPCGTDFATALGMELPRTAAEGAAIIVKLATQAERPTAGFHDDNGPVPW